MKKIFLLIPLILASGCKDQIVGKETLTKTITTPSICPPSYYPDPSVTDFEGAKLIDSVEQNRFKVHWNESPKASAYLVYTAKAGEELRLYKSVDKSESSLWINGLEPQREYQVQVKLLDSRGLYDVNQTVLSAFTNNSPAYHNDKSLYFDGFASVSLGPSKKALPSNGFTVSLWFKTSHRQEISEGKLLSFHQGFAAGTAFGIGVKRDKVFLGYRNAAGEYSELIHNFTYNDNSWHHLAATYNGRFLAFYLDGNKITREFGDLIEFGDHPARIGSYTGSQKGFTGLIDEVSLWTTAMGSAKVGELRNGGSPTDLHQHTRSNSLKVWYRMGDDSKDGPGHIEDQTGSIHGDPLNIDSDDFTQDIP